MSFNEQDFIREGRERDEYLLSRDRRRKAELINAPYQYRINLISLGRLGSEFSEILIKELGLNPDFIGLDIWHRIARRYDENEEVYEDDPRNSKAKVSEELTDMMTKEHRRPGEKKHNLREYRTLKCLKKEIVERSKRNPPSTGDITVVTARYDFSFTLKDEDGNAVRDLNPENENDYKIIENTIMTSVYLEEPEEVTRDDIIRTMEDIKRERKTIEGIIDEVCGNKDKHIPPKTWKDAQPWLDRKRAENLIDSIIGVRELGKAFRSYRGNVVLAVNEVDFTHTAFGKSSSMDPRKLDALCDNDQIRNEEFVAEELNVLLDVFDSQFLVVPTWGPHNEYVMPLLDLSDYKDKPLYGFVEAEKLQGIQLKVKQRTAEFGHWVFETRGASDKDAALALYNVIESIMFKGERSKRPLRSVVGFPNENYSVGMPVKHNPYGIQEPLMSQKRKMGDSERKNFERAVQVIKYINDRLVKAGILPEKWEYEEFQPPRRVPISVETALTEEDEEESKIIIPTEHEIRLYAKNTKHPERLVVYDLIRKRHVDDVIFDESIIDHHAWLIGVKEYEDSVIALLGRRRDEKSYDHFAFRINPETLESELIGQINIAGEVDPASDKIRATVSDFDFYDGKLFLAIKDETDTAVVPFDTVKKEKESRSYVDHPKSYQSVRVVPTTPFKVVGLSDKEINFWEGGNDQRDIDRNKKCPHNLVGLNERILKEMKISPFRDVYLVSFCSNGIGRIAILNGRNEKIEREFDAKDNRMELYPDGDYLSTFVVNPLGILQRFYTNSLIELLGTKPLKHEPAEVKGPANAVIAGGILGINSTKDIVVVTGKEGYLLFDKNPLKYRDCVDFENAGKGSYVIKQRS